MRMSDWSSDVCSSDLLAGVVAGARERLGAGDLGDVGGRQAPGGHHQELRAELVAPVGGGGPTTGAVVVGGADDLGVELDVAPEVVAVGHVIGVAEDLGLGGVALRQIGSASCRERVGKYV